MYRKSIKRVLVLTLNSGENELSSSLDMLKMQSYKKWEQIVFSNMSNREAHDTLYSCIMTHTNNYDIFIKLDADMVLKDRYSLEKIVEFFECNPEVDQANFSVFDTMSGLDIMGVLVFTNKAYWPKSEETLFVDHTPIIPGKRLLVWDTPAPVALHCPNPHWFQSFHYGVHRALKATQRGRKKRWIQSALQWHLLMRVWKHYQRSKDRNRAFFLLGVLSVLKHDVDSSANEYNNQSLIKKYEEYITWSIQDINLLLSHHLLAAYIYINHLLYLALWPKIMEYKIRSRVRTWYMRTKNKCTR